MKKFKKINNEVYYTEKKITQIDDKDILFLKSNVHKTKKKRIRICAHINEKDNLQEMFVALSNKTYIRPHKHFNKSESLHVIYGSADVVFFDDRGIIKKIISLSNNLPDSSFYYRISKPIYHTFIIKSDCFIFHETTQGPLKKSDSIFASWSPKDTEFKKILLFKKKLFKDVGKLRHP
jgi:cupin fold WbuC family metalloprotein|tara:strand:+ start:229 stop:762 length:534 start_codon:yes stop_codon:yes gene_type:complete